LKILFIGDVVGYSGCSFLWEKLPSIKHDRQIDITVVNGENSAVGNGISIKSAEHLFNSGADVITTGNHCFRRKDCNEVFERENILRPYNFPEGVVGKGSCTLDFGRYSVAFINLIGTVYLTPVDNPYFAVDKALSEINTPNIFVDFHAEATAEKKSMAYYLTGRVTALLGTHTHVQTNDECILGNHTGYITDVGMTGAEDSVLGIDSELACRFQKYHIPVKFEESQNPPFLCGVIVDFDETSGKCKSIEKIIVR
jgi:metallophosphoesterase (TIGR00282 family)